MVMMAEQEWLVERFEEHRAHLRSVAYRMLGSLHEADDAVQESWLRLNRADTADVENLRGWLTTVTGRVCLDLLRVRTSQREHPFDVQRPDSIAMPPDAVDPEHEVILSESVGFALHVVLESLNPAERLTFVLHDMFSVPFNEIAPMLGRSTNATKQLASRARARIRAAGPMPDADLTGQHEAVRAFFEAARHGDFDALVALLDPNVELRTDGGVTAGHAVARGAAAVAGRALMFARPDATVQPALINGAAGVVVTVGRRPVSVMGFTVRDGVIVAIAALVDVDRLERLDLSEFVK
jgi:RNA polymerase sigma factor (sigma-70 family)